MTIVDRLLGLLSAETVAYVLAGITGWLLPYLVQRWRERRASSNGVRIREIDDGAKRRDELWEEIRNVRKELAEVRTDRDRIWRELMDSRQDMYMLRAMNERLRTRLGDPPGAIK